MLLILYVVIFNGPCIDDTTGSSGVYIIVDDLIFVMFFLGSSKKTVRASFVIGI